MWTGKVTLEVLFLGGGLEDTASGNHWPCQCSQEIALGWKKNALRMGFYIYKDCKL